MSNEPPTDGTFETKDNQPGYHIPPPSASEHGSEGLKPGWSNSPGMGGEDEDDSSSEDSKPAAKRAPAKAADSK
jgi:hypothetical protein